MPGETPTSNWFLKFQEEVGAISIQLSRLERVGERLYGPAPAQGEDKAVASGEVHSLERELRILSERARTLAYLFESLVGTEPSPATRPGR